MDLLYHYGSNQSCFGILNDKSIRMSDIRKSNDYEELVLLYPDIFEKILIMFRESPFEFRYKSQTGGVALRSLIDITDYMINNSIECGDFSNFVVCFSEEADLLSQWRGYANNGQGISIGFSKELLQKKCDEEYSIFRLERVEYITEEERQQIIKNYAAEALEMLRDLRKWIVENMTNDDTSLDTDGLLGFNFHGWVKSLLTDSLKYKQVGFKEEKEWRLFLSDQAYKEPEWVLGQSCEMQGPNGFSETLSFLRNRISFNITHNNISPYVPLPLSELGEDIVKAIWIGPKSQIASQDMKLYLAQHGYENVEIFYSGTSFR